MGDASVQMYLAPHNPQSSAFGMGDASVQMYLAPHNPQSSSFGLGSVIETERK